MKQSIIVFLVSVCILFCLIKHQSLVEYFDSCSDYKTWHSCTRSFQDYCKWSDHLNLCYKKCHAFDTKSCPSQFCHTAGKHCLEGNSSSSF